MNKEDNIKMKKDDNIKRIIIYDGGNANISPKLARIAAIIILIIGIAAFVVPAIFLFS